ncbi:MAG: DNA polymerase III subunit delta [Flavobacteriales bacterium]
MNFENILSDLKAKKYHPVYFLMGEESFFIDAITDEIAKNCLDDSEKDFNQYVLYGKDTSTDTIISTAKQFPLMGERIVVIVKEAQHIRQIEKLQAYIDQPQLSTLLVICYKNKVIDKRKAFSKVLSQKTVVFESKKLYDNQVPDWIVNYLKGQHFSISQKAAHLLSEYLGNDLNKIINELGKLMLLVPPESEISADIVERNIGISKDYNNFELTKALSQKDVLKSNQIANYFAKNPNANPIVVTLGTLFNFFQKLLLFHVTKDKSPRNVASVLKVNPYFVKEYQHASNHYGKRQCMTIISLIREYDLKAKGLNNHSNTSGELLKELLFKILH